MGKYDPEFFRAEPDQLIDDDGKVLGTKDRLVPIREAQDELPLHEDPSLMYRGMSSGEYEAYRRTGVIKSASSYNIGAEQQGLTYWGADPSMAETYASAFAPREFKPDWDKPAYVVVAKRVGAERLRRVKGTGEGELGVIGETPKEDVREVWRGRVIERDPGYSDEHGSLSPSARLHWERVFPKTALDAWFEDAARKNPQAKHPKTGKFAKAHVVARELHRHKKTGRFQKQGPKEGVQAKAEAAEKQFAKLGGEWDVQTANDDKVCKICQGISDNGPYSLGEARSLIPAHPNCRCLFVPAGELEDAALGPVDGDCLTDALKIGQVEPV
jgi:hypothetical protein